MAEKCDDTSPRRARGVQHGASPEEAAEAIGVTFLMNGGPATVYGARAFAAFQEFYGQRVTPADAPSASRGASTSSRPPGATRTPTSGGEELADSQAEFRGVQDPVAVQFEPAERSFGLIRARPVDGGELRYPAVQDPVAVDGPPSRSARPPRRVQRCRNLTGPRWRGSGPRRTIPRDFLVAVGVHVRQHRVEQRPLPVGHRPAQRRIGRVAEGLAQLARQLLAVFALPDAVPVGVHDREPAFPSRPA